MKRQIPNRDLQWRYLPMCSEGVLLIERYIYSSHAYGMLFFITKVRRHGKPTTHLTSSITSFKLYVVLFVPSMYGNLCKGRMVSSSKLGKEDSSTLTGLGSQHMTRRGGYDGHG
jgi:hypothetical protein